MALQDEIKTINAVSLVQLWLSKKNPIPIGTKYLINGQNKTITLIECEGYPKGKFIYENGEDFDIGKNVECEFIQLVEIKEEQNETVYDEEVWDALDLELNGKEVNGKKEALKIKDETSPIILKSLGEEQKNNEYRDFVYYDVTNLIETLLKNKIKAISEYDMKFLQECLINNSYPFFTKEKLMIMFTNCSFIKTSKEGILKLKRQNEEVGFLIADGDRYFFAPKRKTLSDEYSIEENKATGFYFTAESYLDIAISTIEKYKNQFLAAYNSNPDRNIIEFGYQASSSIKTLLAFACECYLKALLIDDGKNISDIKAHNLSILYTALDNEVVSKVFSYMERNGYNLPNKMYERVIETNDLTEKFMLDLARTDSAFIDSRYCAEADKNTDYQFLFNFALALRNSTKKEFIVSSPFSDSIEEKLNKR